MCLSNFKAIRQFKVPISWLPDFTRSNEKTSFRILRRSHVSALTRGLFWCLFPELRSNDGIEHQNNTRVSAETVRYKSSYIISFLTRHTDSINDDGNDDLSTSSQCLTRSVFDLLMTSQSIAADVTMTWQLWRDHVNSDIQQVRYRFCSRRYSRPVVQEIVVVHRGDSDCITFGIFMSSSESCDVKFTSDCLTNVVSCSQRENNNIINNNNNNNNKRFLNEFIFKGIE